jgi:hypothetical protein
MKYKNKKYKTEYFDILSSRYFFIKISTFNNLFIFFKKKKYLILAGLLRIVRFTKDVGSDIYFNHIMNK